MFADSFEGPQRVRFLKENLRPLKNYETLKNHDTPKQHMKPLKKTL